MGEKKRRPELSSPKRRRSLTHKLIKKISKENRRAGWGKTGILGKRETTSICWLTEKKGIITNQYQEKKRKNRDRRIPTGGKKSATLKGMKLLVTKWDSHDRKH